MKGNSGADVQKIAIDFGGTLVKVAVFDKKRCSISLASFPIKNSDIAFNFIRQYSFSEVCCTGGGSVKYENLILGELEVPLRTVEEVAGLCGGVEFALQRELAYSLTNEGKSIARMPVLESQMQPVGGECTKKLVEKMQTTDSHLNAHQMSTESNSQFIQYPYLIVNIGTGTSIVLVKANGDFERVGGTPLSGGTFFGLASLLHAGCCTEESFEELCNLACSGNAKSVDLTVENIYGNEIPESLHLSADALASSFGKVNYMLNSSKKQSSKDMLASVLEMVCYNTCHLAWLIGKEYGASSIVFTGSFVAGVSSNERVREKLQEWLSLVSRQKFRAFFVENGEFVGALGCLWQMLQSNAEAREAVLKAKVKRKAIYFP